MIVIFDLDGTVWDSAPGIVGCIRACFDHYGIDVPPDGAVLAALGPPLRTMLGELGMPEELLDDSVERYRDEYHDWGVLAAVPYDGIVAVLDGLRSDGHRLATATSKGQTGTDIMIDHFDLRDRFDFVGAASMDGLATTKREVIARTLTGLDVTDPSHCVMVGDRHHDVSGAAAHHIPCIGVTWGYGTEAELVEAGAIAIARTPAQVPALLPRNDQGRR